MSFNAIITILKGGSGSGNFGHAGRPGEVGGSAAGGITTAHVKKLQTAIAKAERGKLSAGYIGSAKTAELLAAGYIESVGGPYYKLTQAGVDLVEGKTQVAQAIKQPKPAAEKKPFNLDEVKPGDSLSYANANEYIKTLPGYVPNVDVVKMTDARSIRTPGATAAARYYEGRIEFPAKTRARTIAHELGHYIYDFNINSDARSGVHNEFKKAKVTGGDNSPLRPYAMRYAHEFFADMYSDYLYGNDSRRNLLHEHYPHTANVVKGIING